MLYTFPAENDWILKKIVCEIIMQLYKGFGPNALCALRKE